MSAKSVRLIALSIVTLLVIGFLASIQGVTAVNAQSPAPTSSCMTCHEDQYFLHDSGKWYCVTEAQERCVNCHAGDASAPKEKDAHTGLIAKPLNDGGQHCQTCHAQDTESLVQKVIGLTGYHAQIETEAYNPQTSASSSQPISLPASSESPTPIWFLPAAIAVFTFWVMLVTHTSHA